MKEINQWPIQTHEKVFIIINHQDMAKLRSQRDTTTHPLKWLKLERQTVPSVNEDMEQQELSYTLLVGV